MTEAEQPSLTLYYSPRACSLACHIVLHETGLAFETVEVKISDAEHKQPEYLNVNPFGKIPALAVNSEILTEAHAILTYLGDLARKRNLIPSPGTLARARAHEWMNFLSSTVHIAFRTVFRPYNLVGEQVPLDPVRDFGRANLIKVMGELERRLSGNAYALGEAFSVCDAYLFVFYLWCHDARLEMESPAGPTYRALAERVWERSSARAAVEREGIVTPF